MGYILPVTQYEYINYQKRMTEAKKTPYHIDRLHKVILKTNVKQNYPNDPHFKHKDKVETYDQTYTQMTGKGTYVDIDA